MSAIFGVVGIALAMLIFAAAYRAFRAPDPARWTQSEAAAVSVSLLVVAIFGFSFAFIARAADDIGALVAQVGPVGLGAIAAGFLAVLALLFYRRSASPSGGLSAPSMNGAATLSGHRAGRPGAARRVATSGAAGRRAA